MEKTYKTRGSEIRIHNEVVRVDFRSGRRTLFNRINIENFKVKRSFLDIPFLETSIIITLFNERIVKIKRFPIKQVDEFTSYLKNES